jgi:hypothetical protein
VQQKEETMANDTATDRGGPSPIDAPLWPDHLVVGLFDSKSQASRAQEALRTAGFPQNQVWTFSGSQAARRMDPMPANRNWLKRLARFTWLTVTVEAQRLKELAIESRERERVIAVKATDDDQADEVARVLAAHGSKETTRFSRGRGVEVNPDTTPPERTT